MDFNEFSFEALFKCPSFKWCYPPKAEAASKEFDEILKSKITDGKIYLDIEYAVNKFNSISQDAAFEQGFCFAVKLMKKLYDMSFSISR